MVWWEWILFILTISIGTIIGEILVNILDKWYKKRKNKE